MIDIISKNDALLAGLNRYFTGKPCKYGHISERYVNKSRCVSCSIVSSIKWTKSNPDKARARVNRSYRKNADKRRAYAKAHRNQNIEKTKAIAKKSYIKNKEKYLASSRSWKKNNPERVRRLYRDWVKNNPDRAREHSRNNAKSHIQENRIRAKKWRKNNLERANNNRRVWARDHPEKLRAIRHKREALERNAEGAFTSEDLKRIFKMQNGRCAYCRIPLRKKYEIDHITALSKGGSNYANNIQLLCDRVNGNGCNQSKRDHDPIDFARTKGFLL